MRVNNGQRALRRRVTGLRALRWAQIIILMVVYIGAMEVMMNLGWVGGVLATFCCLSSTHMILIGSLFSFSIFTVLLRVGAFELGHFRSGRCKIYPPFWVSAFLAVVARPVWHPLINGNDMNWGIVGPQIKDIVVPLSVGLAVAIGLYQANRQWVRPSPKQQGANNITGTGGKITYRGIQPTLSRDDALFLDWLHTERPIKRPDEDRLGHDVYARRITERLLGPGSGGVALIGPHGSGKSSVLNMVEYYLRNPDNLDVDGPPNSTIVVCRIDGWGRARESIAQQVLTIVIEELKGYVDVSALVGLPVMYEQMLTAGHPFLGAAAKALLAGGETVDELLWRLDNILAAAGLHVILFVEDLDRDVDHNVLKVEIPGLLDRLKSLWHVSFLVAATNNTFSRKIVQRICEHTEEIA